MTIELTAATDAQKLAIRSALAVPSKTEVSAKAEIANTFIKITHIDKKTYASTADVAEGYPASRISTRGQAVAFDGYPGGAAIVELKNVAGAMQQTVITTYFDGLSVIVNFEENTQYTWDVDRWYLDKQYEVDTIRKTWATEDVAVLIESGGSNAESGAPIGSALPTMSNVKGLARSANLSITLTDVTWSTFAAGATSSLGNSAVGANTTSIVTEFARLWQEHITAGNNSHLPDLYIIRIPWASTSIGTEPGAAGAQWDIEGKTSSSSISASDLSFYQQFIVHLALRNLVKSGKRVRIIGNLWSHGEQDAKNSTSASKYLARVLTLFRTLDDVAGVQVPSYITLLRSNDPTLTSRDAIVSAQFILADSRILGVTLDPYDDPQGSEDRRSTTGSTQGGIFNSDFQTLSTRTIGVLAQNIFTRVQDGYRGRIAWPRLTLPKLNFF